MKFLIKDLAKMTDLNPDRIRKWQERYHILNPELGKNGYHYYNNNDLKILLFIKKELKAGKRIKQIIEDYKKSKTLNFITNDFTSEELTIINSISNFDYKPIELHLSSVLKKQGFYSWLREIHKLILLTGKAWEKNLISISDEHSFSNWLRGNLLTFVVRNMPEKKAIWLVCTFPGDEHELGAILHYVKLLKFKVPARYVGNLPKDELLREIKVNQYIYVSISIVMPRKWKEIQKLKEEILKIANIKVLFGGYGYKKLKKYEKNYKKRRKK